MNTKAHCNNCDGERNHVILFTTTTSWAESEYGIFGNDNYQVLKCGGCDRVILKHTSIFSEDLEPTVLYYPASALKKKPRWLYDMSGHNVRIIQNLLNEVYVGLQNGTKMLATMGVRALLEHVMINAVSDRGTFAGNLAEFAKQGYISAMQRNILDTVLEAGHAVIHRAYEPTDEDLSTCIDIAESVIQTIYVHPDKAAELKKRIPKKK